MLPSLPPRRFAHRALALGAVSLAAMLGADTSQAGAPAPPKWDIEVFAPTAFEGRAWQDSDPVETTGPMSLPINFPSFAAINALADDRPLPPIHLFDLNAFSPVDLPLRVEPLVGEQPAIPGFLSLVLPTISVQNGGLVEIRPVLEVGHHYRVEATSTCECGEQRELAFEFEATAAAPLPTTTGKLAMIDAHINEYFSRGRDTLSYDVRARLEASADLLPWKNAYKVKLSVDEAPSYIDEDMAGRLINEYTDPSVSAALTPDGLYTGAIRCGAPFAQARPGVPERHTLRLIAYPVSFVAPTLVSDPIEVALDCSVPAPPAPPEADGDDDDDDGSSQGAPPDPPVCGNGGCAVAAPGRSTGATLMLVGLGAVAATIAARRRRR